MHATYMPLTIPGGIRAAARRTPGKVALEEGERALTYAALIDRIDRLTTAAVQGLGLGSGVHSGVLAPNCLEYVELVSGLAAAGSPAALLNTHSTSDEIRRACDDAGVRVLFVHASLEEVARAAPPSSVERIVVLGSEYEDILARARPTPEPMLDDTDTFCIPYTSGTTGEPKGLLLSHRARALTFFGMAVDYGAFGPEVRSLCVAPIYHGAGFVSVFAPVFFGGFCSILPRFNPEEVLTRIEDLRITAVNLVPTHFSAILALDGTTLARSDTSSLRALLSNAASLPQSMKERIVETFGEGILHESYGSTEAGFISTLKPEDQLRKNASVGREFPCVEVRILGEDGLEVAQGDIGDIYSRSPYLFSGYWNRPDATARAFRDGWFTSGDLGRRDDEGYLYIADRRDDRIVTGGVNVYPRDIEEELLRHPGIAEVAVIGLPDPYWGEAVHAAITLRPGSEVRVEELQAYAAARLAAYKRPKGYTVLTSLPRNSLGKVLRREVRDKLAARADEPPSPGNGSHA